MVSMFTQPDVNTREVGRTRDKRGKPRREAETILHFFYKITNERGTKTVFTYAHVKWFYGQSERAYYLNYFINNSNNSVTFNSMQKIGICFLETL